MENINSWKDIQWSSIEEKVFRLQLRIYRAAADQDWGKMYKLQKLLLASKSAKYLAVRKVTQDNTGNLVKTPSEKFKLANRLMIDGKSSPIRRTYIPRSDGSQRPLGISTIEDRAKQMLAYLALSPQWEAQFEASRVLDAIEAVFLGIAKKEKWVLDANISKCFDRINHQYLIEKCNTYPEIQKQIRAWLKAGILDGGDPAQGGVISPLLANIALHGLRDSLDAYINTLGGHRPNNRQALTFVRYADDFVLMYPEKEVLENLKEGVQQFLKPIGLELNSTKTRMVHTLNATKESPPGFTFLGFDVVQKAKSVYTKRKSNQNFLTLITPSKEGVKRHKEKIREIIRRHRGSTQERLIQKLNPVIRGWALSKRTQISSKTFQDLDQYLFTHLWKWAKRRHPKMSKIKLKKKYWHQIGSSNWRFGVKKGEEIPVKLQLHSKIPIQRHAKVKGICRPLNGNFANSSSNVYFLGAG